MSAHFPESNHCQAFSELVSKAKFRFLTNFSSRSAKSSQTRKHTISETLRAQLQPKTIRSRRRLNTNRATVRVVETEGPRGADGGTPATSSGEKPVGPGSIESYTYFYSYFYHLFIFYMLLRTLKPFNINI